MRAVKVACLSATVGQNKTHTHTRVQMFSFVHFFSSQLHFHMLINSPKTLVWGKRLVSSGCVTLNTDHTDSVNAALIWGIIPAPRHPPVSAHARLLLTECGGASGPRSKHFVLKEACAVFAL